MSTLANAILRGTHADRPTDNSVGTTGRLYYETDTSTLFRDNGTGWDSVEGASAPAFVGARYTTNTAQAVTSTPTIIDFEDVDYDPGTIVTTGASWHVTIPTTGYYRLTAMVTLASASWAVGNDITMYLYVGGASVGAIGRLTGASGTILNNVVGTDTRHYTAGDQVDIRVTQSAQTSINTYNSGDFNHLAFEKVG